MNKQNHFTSKFRKKTNQELEYILENPSNYVPNAIQAAIWILEERGSESEQMSNAQEKIDDLHQQQSMKREKDIGIPIQTQDSNLRLLHWIIDSMLIQAAVYVVALLPDVDFNMLFAFAFFPVYYIYFETKYRQTPGKMVTDSIVTYADGKAPTTKSVILRTAARYIPFEAFSCLGQPSWGWHDQWTKTYVIKKSDLEKLKKQTRI
ncbi:MAG: hypothetical protein CL840_13650 [Crocinitomicaceae bacterium]|nr:hypothetical protein [Crocinitomicaceae bacterium]|tara:strand:- start:820 stop:1437 length:618 start_codon:yes stop_codon:yes gene_type:complete